MFDLYIKLMYKWRTPLNRSAEKKKKKKKEDLLARKVNFSFDATPKHKYMYVLVRKVVLYTYSEIS